MSTITANAVTGNASAGSTWVGGVVPVNGDIAVIPVGADITWDYDVTLGDTVVHAGLGLHIEAASQVSFGRVTVGPGVSLTLASQDEHTTGTDYPLVIDQWAQFIVGPDATLILDLPSTNASWVINNGIFHAIGTPGHNATITTPTSKHTWATAASISPPNLGQYYDRANGINCFPLEAGISNAVGTGLGSLGDSSLSFSVGATLFTHEVASIEACYGTPGNFFVDYQNGILYYYSVPNNVTWTANFKHVDYIGVPIKSMAATDGNEFIARYTNIQYIGDRTESGGFILSVTHKRVGSGVSRDFEVTHCNFLFCSEAMGTLDDVVGTAVSNVLIEDNTFWGMHGDAYGPVIGMIGASSNAYISFQRNVGAVPTSYTIQGYVPGANYANWTIDDNVFITNTLLRGALGGDEAYFPDLHVGSFVRGLGSPDSRVLHQFRGTLGHPAVVESIIWRGMRVHNLSAYNQLKNSIIAFASHHTTMGRVGGAGPEDTLGQIVDHNLILEAEDNGSLQLCYNGPEFADGAQATHNTIHNSHNTTSLSFGDQTDPGGTNLFAGLVQSSNLVTNGAGAGMYRRADNSNTMARVHVAGMDYNCLHGNTPDFSGLTRFATFSGLVNVLGVSLFNPSYSVPFSGKALVFTYTSATNQTLAWDGGTAVQLVQATSTATGSTNTLNPSNCQDYGTLQDTAQTWSSDYSLSTQPVGCWVIITGGTGVGQIRRVVGPVSATEVQTVPSWTTPPDATSTYALIKSEVILTAGDANTVNCGVDVRSLPTTSQTDAGVGMTLNSLSVDPMYVDATRTLATWDASLGGPGTETSAMARLFATPTLANSAFKPYMFAGFTPQNAVLATAAADGTTIGAVQFNSGPSAALLNWWRRLSDA